MTKPPAYAGGFVISEEIPQEIKQSRMPENMHTGYLFYSLMRLQLLRSTMVWGTMILVAVRLGFSA
jgi:hypothetical protein